MDYYFTALVAWQLFEGYPNSQMQTPQNLGTTSKVDQDRKSSVTHSMSLSTPMFLAGMEASSWG
jgi:hypothetical protein